MLYLPVFAAGDVTDEPKKLVQQTGSRDVDTTRLGEIQVSGPRGWSADSYVCDLACSKDAPVQLDNTL